MWTAKTDCVAVGGVCSAFGFRTISVDCDLVILADSSGQLCARDSQRRHKNKRQAFSIVKYDKGSGVEMGGLNDGT